MPSPVTAEVSSDLDLSDLLDLLERIVSVQDPRLFQTMAPPVSQERLCRGVAETAVGVLPREVFALLQWHDGQQSAEHVNPRRAWRLLSVVESASYGSRLPQQARSVGIAVFADLDDTPVIYLTRGDMAGQLARWDVERGGWVSLCPSMRAWVLEALEARGWRPEPTKDRTSSSDDSSVRSVVHRRFASATESLTLPQRWILAVGGILTELDGRSHELIGGSRRLLSASNAFASLISYYDAWTTEEAESTLASLLVEHESPEADLSEIHPDEVAWDMGRVGFVAGRAYVCGMLSADVAWSWMTRAARLVQKHYRSWREFGTAYVSRGAEAYDGGPSEQAEMATVLERLLRPGMGVWANLPWDLELGEPPPPVPQAAPWVVSPHGRARTLRLQDAIARAEDGDRIHLQPGTYRCALELTKSLEFIAVEEGVTLECEPGAPFCVSVQKGGVRLEGITIRGGAPGSGLGSGLQVLDAGFARLDQCRIEHVFEGVKARNEGYLVLQDCHLGPCENLGVGNDGSVLVAVDSTVSAMGYRGISLERKAQSLLLRCAIHDCREHALALLNTEIARIVDCRFQDTDLPAICIGAAADGEFRGCVAKNGGVLVTSGGNCRFLDCTFDGSCLNTETGHDVIQVDDVKRLLLGRCKIRNARACGVQLEAGGAVEIRDCEITDTFGSAVACFGCPPRRGILRITGTTLGPARMYGTVYLEHCDAVLEQCRILSGYASCIALLNGASAELTETTLDGSAHRGVTVASGSRLSMDGCHVLNMKTSGFTLEDGTLRLRNSTIDEVGLHGIDVGKNARAQLESCRVAGAAGRGLYVRANGQAVATNSSVESAAHVEASGVLLLADSQLSSSAEHALEVLNASQALLLRCRLTAEGAGGLDARDQAQILALHSVLPIGANGAAIRDEARLLAIECNVCEGRWSGAVTNPNRATPDGVIARLANIPRESSLQAICEGLPGAEPDEALMRLAASCSGAMQPRPEPEEVEADDLGAIEVEFDETEAYGGDFAARELNADTGTDADE